MQYIARYIGGSNVQAWGGPRPSGTDPLHYKIISVNQTVFIFYFPW